MRCFDASVSTLRLKQQEIKSNKLIQIDLGYIFFDGNRCFCQDEVNKNKASDLGPSFLCRVQPSMYLPGQKRGIFTADISFAHSHNFQ
jgi:hypothetical protein